MKSLRKYFKCECGSIKEIRFFSVQIKSSPENNSWSYIAYSMNGVIAGIKLITAKNK